MIEGLKSALLGGALIGAFLFGRHTSYQDFQVDKLIQERDQAVLIKAQYAIAVKAQAELTDQLSQAQSRVRIIKEQVKVYVDPDKDVLCGPSIGVVGLLNQARRPDLPANTPANVEEGRAASGYSASDFNDQNLDVIGRYNALMIEHNKLIDLLTSADSKQPAK